MIPVIALLVKAEINRVAIIGVLLLAVALVISCLIRVQHLSLEKKNFLNYL